MQQLSKEDRNMMISWLMVSEGCTREYWEKQSDRFIELNYKNAVLEEVPEEVMASD